MLNSLKDSLRLITKDHEQILTSWANINSGSYNAPGLQEMGKELEKHFSKVVDSMHRIPADNHSGSFALTGHLNKEAPIKILLGGHMDTVYGPESGFQRCQKISENILKGPGVTDMKGGLLIMFYTLIAFQKFRKSNKLGFDILINPDEEIGSIYTRDFWRDAAQNVSLGIIFEPATDDGGLVKSRLGSAAYTLEGYGKAAHAGRDFKAGLNAIIILSEAMVRIHKAFRDASGMILNVGHVEGGGLLNIVPDKAKAAFNLRTRNDSSEKDALKKIQDILQEIEKEYGPGCIKMNCTIRRGPKECGPSEEFLYEHFKQCGSELGLDLSWKESGGASDGNLLKEHGLPCLDNLGVRGGKIHSEEEFVELDSIFERVLLNVLFLLKLESGDIVLDPQLFPNLR